MEKKDKIIIIGLIIVILVLMAGIAYMFMGNNLSIGQGNVPDGMQRYNFDSAFTMAVPDDAKFLKEFNSSLGEFGWGVTYFDKNNKIAVSYGYSPMITHELINYTMELGNASGNATFEHDGDLIIAHSKVNNGKIGKTFEKSEFKEFILTQRGHEVVLVFGNDEELIKSIAKTLECMNR